MAFSPYSRGWSLGPHLIDALDKPGILPVFAGMVPDGWREQRKSTNSPRIRGDGPPRVWWDQRFDEFSPYSRGWSHAALPPRHIRIILPVFAGMVRFQTCRRRVRLDSPRIRGDGPPKIIDVAIKAAFSPYSRGWSDERHVTKSSESILPVFAGMVPVGASMVLSRRDSPRIRGDGP